VTATNAKPLSADLKAELKTLSDLYRQHLLRYGSSIDFLIDAASIPSSLVLWRVAALVRLINRIAAQRLRSTMVNRT
jgi:hypothetical protein